MTLNNIDETNHKIFAEIDRNSSFIKKIKESEDRVDSNSMEQKSERKLKVDTAAAMRMVKPFLNPTKMDAEALEPQNKPKDVKTGEVRKLNKGSILPKRDHLNLNLRE